MSIPQSLIKSLRDGKLIPFVGAGVSKSVLRKNGSRLYPDWKELLTLAADALDAEKKGNDAILVRALLNIDQPKYLDAAQHARTALGPIWFNFLKTNLNPSSDQLDEASLALPKAIWSLGSELIITTNYDRVLEWSSPKSRDCLDLDIESKAELAALLRNGPNQPTVWHLHGKISNVAELILTTDDYGRLYPQDGETRYRTALESLKHHLASKSLLFIGFSFDDQYFDTQFQYIREIFTGATGPHFILLREGDLTRSKEFREAGIEVVTYRDFGSPLIELLDNISRQAATDQSQPNPSEHNALPAAPLAAATNDRNIKIAILFAAPIDKNYTYDALRELRKLKADITLIHLSLSALNNLDAFDYVFVLSKVSRMKIAIEDEMLSTRWISLKDLEDNIGNENLRGTFVFLDHQKQTELDLADLEKLTQPTIIFPALDKSQISSFSFKIFRKHIFDYVEESFGANLDRLTVNTLNGEQSLTTKTSSLPANIDRRTTENYVGRRTDLENLCRKIIELRGEHDILTIKGSGGLGKTITIKRLAVELADRNLFCDGIDFIDCEFVGDIKAFEDNLARCFNLENALNLTNQIREQYGDQDRLIILDNVETLLHLDSTDQIKQFMTFISEYATIVTTSRELVGLECERLYELRPFTTDEGYDLFVRELPWGDKITNEDKRIIRQDILESLLDNNPLAIKLVTRNIPHGKNFYHLRSELETDFFQKVSQSELEVFDSISDTNIERKKSLYGSINFSYQYLTDKEKVAFELLSLFPDGINLENFKKISQDTKSDSDTRNKIHNAEKLLITDPIIRALENKSLIQVDNNKIKLQSIIGKFAEQRFLQRSESDHKRYYKNAFDYNRSFAAGLAGSFRRHAYSLVKIFNSHQNNFIKSIQYSTNIEFDHKEFLSYLDDLHVLFNAITGTKQLIQALQEQNFRFDDEKEQLCYDTIMLNLEYYAGNFAGAYHRLQEILPLSQLQNLAPDNPVERLACLNAIHLYSYEGESLLAAKFDCSFKRHLSGYPKDFFQLGYFNEELLSRSPIDFISLDVMYSAGILTPELVNTYIKQGIFEKSHLEMTQVHYIKGKMGLLKRQSIKSLVAVNPYTEGLIQLMHAFTEKDDDAKETYFEHAMQYLLHIKYYYVEALYFYAQFLQNTTKTSKFNEVFQLGIKLAREYHYRFLIYRFEELTVTTSQKYDMNRYPLPEEVDFDGYARFLLKTVWRN